MRKAIYTAEFEIMGYTDENMDFIKDSSFVPNEGDEFFTSEEITWQLSELVKFEQKNAIEAENIRLRQYLDETDWYVIRRSETDVPVPADVLQKRQEARDAI